MAFDDAWQETFLMTIDPSGTGTGQGAFEAAGRTEGLRIRLGSKDIDQVVLNNNGRISKFTAEEITEITFDEYTLGAENANGLIALFYGDVSDQVQPISVVNTITRIKIRMAIMWTQDTAATSGAGASASGSAALRVIAQDGYLTANELGWDDMILKSGITFKFVPYNKAGTGRMTAESDDGSSGSGLAALSTY